MKSYSFSDLIQTSIQELYIVKSTGEFYTPKHSLISISVPMNKNNITVTRKNDYYPTTIPKRSLYLEFAPQFITLPEEKLEYYLSLRKFKIENIEKNKLYQSPLKTMLVSGEGILFTSIRKPIRTTSLALKNPYLKTQTLNPNNAVSRVVADTFLQRPKRSFVHLYHIDLDTENNNPENLLFIDDKYKHLTDWIYFQGENHKYKLHSETIYRSNQPETPSEYLSAFELRGDVEVLVLSEFKKWKKTNNILSQKNVYKDFSSHFFSLYPELKQLRNDQQELISLSLDSGDRVSSS